VISNVQRAAILTRALYASIKGEQRLISELYTEDVRAWTPAFSTTSLSELEAQFEHRDEAFSEFELNVMPLDVGGEFGCAEWSVAMTHSGPLPVAAGEMIEPTGIRVTVNGTTIAEFRDYRICSFRQYWDELSVFEQLGLVDRDGAR
jgi:ketosteroid isomerase-like protein